MAPANPRGRTPITPRPILLGAGIKHGRSAVGRPAAYNAHANYRVDVKMLGAEFTEPPDIVTNNVSRRFV